MKTIFFTVFFLLFFIANNCLGQAPTLSYAGPQTYAAFTSITPLAPTGSGVATLGYSSTPVALRHSTNPNYQSSFGVTVDAAGNVYYISFKIIFKVPVGGGQVSTVGQGLISPRGIAADAAGDLYVADAGNSTIVKFAAGSRVPVILGSGFNAPEGVAVDAAGNVYIADSGNNEVKKIPAGSNSVITLAAGFNLPDNVAVDAAGNVYVADYNNNAVKKIPAGGGPVVTLISGFPYPQVLATDAAGNVYAGSQSTAEIKEIPAGGGSIHGIFPELKYIVSLAIDGKGNFYVCEGGPAIVEVSPVGGYFINSFLPAGLTFSNATGIIGGTPTVAGPAINYTITAYNSAGSTSAGVNITINPGISNNDNLFSLTPGAGTLSPVFSPSVKSYSMSVATTQTSLNLTPVLADTTARVRINGSVVKTGTASKNLPLAIGSNTITVLVTAQNGGAKTYTITVTRAADANLANLTPSLGGLSPAFSSAVTAYTISLNYEYASIIFTPHLSDPRATVTVNGSPVASGTASGTIPLTTGHNTVTIVVTAIDGITKTTYTVIVTRGPLLSPNDALANLTPSAGGLSPVFSPSVTRYILSVGNIHSSITFTPHVADANATVTVNGTAVPSGTASQSLPLAVGENVIDVTVTAQNGTSKITLITVTRAGPADELYTLSPSLGRLSPAFSPSVTGYSVTVGSEAARMTFAPHFSDADATVKVNGSTVTSGVPSPDIPLAFGTTVVKIVVTARIGGAKQTYSVTITRVPDANMGDLTPSLGKLSSGFSPYITNYTISLNQIYSSITFTPDPTDVRATVKINGISVAYDKASPPIPLALGPNVITAVVTAIDGITTKTYTVTVTRGGDAGLVNLTPGVGGLSPLFSAAVTSYAIALGNNQTTINFTPHLSDINATVQINGTAVASGTASAPIPLAVGPNVIDVTVTAVDGVTTKTYTVTVTRTAPNADLANLTPSLGGLSPFFSHSVTSYAISLANARTAIAFTPDVSDPAATVKVNGVTVVSGKASAKIPLALGPNVINIVVTAQNGAATKTYTVTVTRAGNANLANLTPGLGGLKPVFRQSITNYSFSLGNIYSSITFTPDVADPAASVKVNGTTVTSGTASVAIPLAVGPNVITVVVTAQDGTTTKTYSVTVTRESAISSNADLANLTPSLAGLSPGFSQSVVDYAIALSNLYTTITFTPHVADANATVKINGTTVTTGTASASIPLAEGPNVIDVVVTAQDGTTTKTYTVTVTRASSISNDADLSSLKVSFGQLDPYFSSSSTSYEMYAPGIHSSINFTPKAANSNATITVNGFPIASGMLSQSLPLAVGQNVVDIVVTAQDGTTVKIYTIGISRGAPPADNSVYQPVSVGQPSDRPGLANDGIMVHQGVSPNGDGINDFLQIDNISQFPDNKLTIMNRNGQLIYEAKGYDNSSKIFDGHSNKNGQMQLPGTYFYQLDYTVNGITKHNTGFLVLKY